VSFKSEHPDYKGYESAEYYVSDLPSEINSALQGFTRQCEDEKELKAIINDIAGRVPMEVTTNWGWSFLIEELPYYVGRLYETTVPQGHGFPCRCMHEQSSIFFHR
jgi:hypothetical protein